MAAHSYWRLLITQAKTALNVVSICELEMFNSSGTSLCTGGTASASSTYDAVNNPVTEAFDGIYSYWDGGSSTSNYWASNVAPTTGAPEWIQYQFTSAVDVTMIRITPRVMSGDHQSPKDFKLQYSDDGSTWTDAGTYSLTWSSSYAKSVPVGTPASGYYASLRFNLTAVQTGGSVATLASIGIRETPGGSNVDMAASVSSNGMFAGSSSNYGGLLPASAFDSNGSTIWASNATVTQWVSCHLPRVVRPEQITFTARNDNSIGQTPTAFDLQGSNDGGATWTTIQSFTSSANWVLGETRTFTVGYHSSWRLYITATGNSAYCAITELEMFNASGTSLCTGGTASASSTGFSLPASQAFDGDYTSGNMWHSNNATPSSGSPDWLRYDFPSPVTVASIRITPRALSTNYAPITFKIQYSDDGTTWTDAASFSTGAWPNVLSRSFAVSASAGQYVAWRAKVTANAATGSASAAEVGFRETFGGSVVTTSTARYAHAGSTFSGSFGPEKAFDANASTLWSASNFGTSWIGYHFPRPLAIREIYWTARNDGGHAQSPTAFDLEGSNDGGFTWTTVASFTATTWTSGQTQTFTLATLASFNVDGAGSAAFLPPVSFGVDGASSASFDLHQSAYPYWRLYVTATGNGSYCAITELEMFDSSGTSLCTGGTATHSSTYDAVNYPASKAFDGNFAITSNFWHSNNATPSSGSPDWLQYSFASPVSVALVRITPRTANYAPVTFKVQYSIDGTNWTDAASYSIGTWATWSPYAKSFPVGTPASGAYAAYKIDVSAVSGGSVVSSEEIGFHETIGGANVHPTLASGTVLAHSSSAAFLSSTDQAFDGSTSSFHGWVSLTAAPQWILITLARAVKVVEFFWRARTGGSSAESPTAFDLSGSNDGVNWTVVQSFVSPATWTSGEVRTFTVVPPFAADGSSTIAFGTSPGAAELTFGADGRAYIEFTPRDDMFAWVRVDGVSDIKFMPSQNEAPDGFSCDGSTDIYWNFGNSFRADGRAAISFTASYGPGQYGFSVDGESNVRFALQGGMSIDCLAPGTALPGRQTDDNYVF